jgi:hypothetical protein
MRTTVPSFRKHTTRSAFHAFLNPTSGSSSASSRLCSRKEGLHRHLRAPDLHPGRIQPPEEIPGKKTGDNGGQASIPVMVDSLIVLTQPASRTSTTPSCTSSA